MNNEQLLQNESSKRQYHQDLEHESRMSFLVQQEEYGLFSLLKPRICVDGNQWCCLYGENIQDGIAGFGDTPYLAILDWNKEFHKSKK